MLLLFSAGFILGSAATNLKYQEATDTQYLLWTKSNLMHPNIIRFSHSIPRMAGDLKRTHFRAQDPVKILVHGFLDHPGADWILDMKELYLSLGDYNVVAIDWQQLSGNTIFDYPRAAISTGDIGKVSADFIKAILVAGGSLDRVHLIGFSLGAQVVGCLGRELKGKVARVTGLDPAAPFFVTPSKRIGTDSARLVDVIHTTGGLTSIVEPVGHVDFYPNGGSSPQPGCDMDLSFIGGKCSHLKAPKYFLASIAHKRSFKSRQVFDEMDQVFSVLEIS